MASRRLFGDRALYSRAWAGEVRLGLSESSMPMFVDVVTVVLVVVVVGAASGEAEEEEKARAGDRISLVEAPVRRERPGDSADEDADTETASDSVDNRRRR